MHHGQLLRLLIVKCFRLLLCITNHSIKHQSFIYTQLNEQIILFQAIFSSINHSLNIKQFYLTHRWDPIRCYHSSSEWTRELWQWSSTLHSPNLQPYCSLIIRLLSVISRKLVVGVTPSAEKQSVYSIVTTGRLCWCFNGTKLTRKQKWEDK